jgi:hypothetical protein
MEQASSDSTLESSVIEEKRMVAAKAAKGCCSAALQR